jgi:hypothetical protein
VPYGFVLARVRVPAAPHRDLIVVPRPLPAALLVVLRINLNVAPRPLPAEASHCLSQVLDRGAQAVARGAATLSQRKKSNSVVFQRKRLSIAGFICTMAKVTLAAMYLRRVRVLGRSYAAALTHISTVVTSPAPAAQNLGVGLRRPCRRQKFSRRRATRHMYSG